MSRCVAAAGDCVGEQANWFACSYATDCFGDATQLSCDCLIDGEVVGSCDTVEAYSCEPTRSCCAGILFVVGP